MSHYSWPPDVEQALSERCKTVATAGAGTGKTAFATDKVLSAISADDVSIVDVVCITFTKKAAGELKQRLRHLFLERYRETQAPVWRRQARLLEHAPICTIHSLAQRILQAHPLDAGLDVGFSVLEAHEAAQLRQEAIERVLRRRFLEDGVYAELADRYGWEDRRHQPGLQTCLREAFGNWFESGADADLLMTTLAQNWAENVETGRAFAAVFDDVIHEYEKLKRGSLDFHNLLRHAVRLLRDRLDIRRRYQDRCGLVILDEGQDTEPLQLELVGYLAQEPGDTGRWPELRLSDKLVVVGDRKQAIFRFRGADHRRFESLGQVIERQQGHRVSLQENRRCHPSIIRFVNTLAAELFRETLDYDPERDDLLPRRVVPEDGSRVWYVTRTHAVGETADQRRAAEADDIAQLIAWLTNGHRGPVKVYDMDDRQPRVPQFGDIAILFARTTAVQVYTAALQRHHIPFSTDRSKYFFQTPEIRDAIAFLRAVQNPRDRLAQAEVLRNPIVGLNDSEWIAAMRGLDVGLPIFSAGKGQWVLELLTKFRQTKDRISPAELLERWWQATGQRAALACDEQARQRLANLAKLQDMARQASATGMTLREFIDDISAGASEEPQAPTVGEGDNAVRLLTVHNSKGLEFKVVIVADCAAQVSSHQLPALVFDRQDGLIGKVWDAGTGRLMPSTAYADWVTREKQQLEADQRKLLYVAATRARDLLVFSGSYRATKTGKPRRYRCWRRWIDDTAATHPVEEPALRYLHAEELEAIEVPSNTVLWPRDEIPAPPVETLPPLPASAGLRGDEAGARSVLKRIGSSPPAPAEIEETLASMDDAPNSDWDDPLSGEWRLERS